MTHDTPTGGNSPDKRTANDRPEDHEHDERSGTTEGERDDSRGARRRMKDVSHTPPHGDGANRVWDGTRVYDDGDDDE